MSWKSAMLASAAAGLFVAGTAGLASAQEKKAEAEKVKCEGVNECKGTGACAGEGHGCGGQNGCKGQGFLELTKEECDAAKAKLKKN
jgi:uncharacterized membrane protein